MIDPMFYPVLTFLALATVLIIFVAYFYTGDQMSPEQKREALKRSYPSKTWSDKVDKMSDKQVHATYMRLLNANKL